MFCVLAGQSGRGGGVFPLHRRLGRRWEGSGDGGFVPGAGVGSDGGEGSGLEGCAAGGELDLAAVGGEVVSADAVELSQGSGGAEVLVAVVGVADVGCGEGVVDEGLDHRGVDADGDVAADSFLGPVPHGPQMQEVFTDPERASVFASCRYAATTWAVLAWAGVRLVVST